MKQLYFDKDDQQEPKEFKLSCFGQLIDDTIEGNGEMIVIDPIDGKVTIHNKRKGELKG